MIDNYGAVIPTTQDGTATPRPYGELSHAERCELLAVDGGWTEDRHGIWWSPDNESFAHKGSGDFPDPYNNPADHWALRKRMDEQGVVHFVTRSGVQAEDAVVYLYDKDGNMKGAEFSCHPAEVAAICEAYGRLKGLWS